MIIKKKKKKPLPRRQFAWATWKHYCTGCDSQIWMEFYMLEKIEDDLWYSVLDPAPTEYHGKCKRCYNKKEGKK